MISCENISFSYIDGTKALDNVSLSIEEGTVTGVIGANGAGKSTLFLNLLAVNKPTEGTIYWDNEPIKYDRDFLTRYREYINLVFQNPDQQIFFSSIYDDVAFALRNLDYSEEIIDQRVRESLAIVGLEDIMEKPVHYLSYGQKKRVAIAGVLAMDAEVILLDEPTAGLDPEMTREMIDLIKMLEAKGKSLMVSSHDMDFIYKVCSKLYLMENGKISLQGSKEKVFLDKEKIENMGLEQPTLVRLHCEAGIPLFSNEADLVDYLKTNK